MYKKEDILEIVEKELEGTPHFIADLDVNAANRITLFVDSDESVSIDYCVSLSKAIESKLDREIEDFELMVSSAGLSENLKLPRQYRKHIGKMLEVHMPTGSWVRGELMSADDEGFVLQMEEMVKVEGKKKKQMQISQSEYKYDDIKSARLHLSF